MLETIQSYIKELPDTDFNTHYQQYILSIQDENILSESQVSDSTFTNISKLLVKIQREIGNL